MQAGGVVPRETQGTCTNRAHSASGSGVEARWRGPPGTDSELFNKYSRESGFPGKNKLV